MSLRYNLTFSSVLSSSAPQSLGTLVSAAAWIFPTSQVGDATIIAHGPYFGERFCLKWDASGTQKLKFQTAWSGVGTGAWGMTTGFTALNKWLWIGFTYDLSPGVDPTLYTLEDNVFRILTEANGGLVAFNTAGTPNNADPQTLWIGNSSLGNNVWDGFLGEVPVWMRLLSASEMEAVAVNGVNTCPDHFNYLPQDGGSLQNLGSSGTAFTTTDTAAAENPPIRPAGRRG